MTREEALEKLREAGKGKLFTEGVMIDGFVALGMLKLEEPKSVSDRTVDILESYIEHSRIGNFLHDFDRSNLKIVSK